MSDLGHFSDDEDNHVRHFETNAPLTVLSDDKEGPEAVDRESDALDTLEEDFG